MAYFLFVDESGQDRKEVPYEVLAGVVIKDEALWPLIQEIKNSEMKYFGDFYQIRKEELKAKKLLKTKTYRLANQMAQIDDGALHVLTRKCFTSGAAAKKIQLTALAQSKIKYVNEVFHLCKTFDCRVFASIIDYRANQKQPELLDFTDLDFLRKDYSFLFERYFYFLEDNQKNDMGIVVFDELERSKSHILISSIKHIIVGLAIIHRMLW